ncbi:ATPase [Chitinimonas arctica]|uniref:histidine kinase n=1 Tax=Chitinimonas arctica TaxID=2594795 RepID=A0A516SK04_9NEIS|nr:ATP-binding protein [Chitinimonas arctica]QDQ28486.1 ATPase [Chitinimonas arctica]
MNSQDMSLGESNPSIDPTSPNEAVLLLNQRLAQMQSQLLQSEKMASIGQLAAGVAHEINNPIGYVNSNLNTLQAYIDDLFKLLNRYEQLEEHLPATVRDGELRLAKQQIDVQFLRDDLGALLNESKEGILRVKKIVQDLKDFSRLDANDTWEVADLHHCLDSTLNIVHSEIKYRAKVIKEYGDLPEIVCLPSQLNQVFMNMLVNASHAMQNFGTIWIRTGQDEKQAWVEFEDNGSGISPENRMRIFDPFFTTKPVGKGTGLGLSLSYGIVQKHGGRIELESEVGKGSRFRICLPKQQPAVTANLVVPANAN